MNTEQEHAYIERFGLYFERLGLTRMAGRIIGYLMICEPVEQSMADLCDALDAAKSSVSTALRTLTELALVEQIGIRGERRDYYRVSGDIWYRSFAARMQQLSIIRALAEDGITLLGGDTPERRRRLELMRDYNAFMEREFTKLLQKWESERRKLGYDEE